MPRTATICNLPQAPWAGRLWLSETPVAGYAQTSLEDNFRKRNFPFFRFGTARNPVSQNN